MPIRIRRDDEPVGQPEPDPVPQPDIVVTAGTPPEAPAAQIAATPPTKWAEEPTQTSWAMVGCQCTVTGRSYQLALRREKGTYTLKSIDPGAAPVGAKDSNSSSLNQLGGPFDWTGFECPDCEASWSRYRKRGLYIINCSCGSLFCGSEESKGGGLTAKDSVEGKEWWWRCPSCKIEQRVQLGIEAVSGQTMKGK